MATPNRKDLRKLRALRGQVEKIESCYQGMTQETKDFLREEFTGETELHLSRFDDNLRDCEYEILKPKKNESKM